METIIERGYCLRHPRKIIRLFGMVIYLGLLFDKKKTLLEHLINKHNTEGVPMPGSIGNAYKLSALIEFRVARIYKTMAEQFKDNPQAHRLFMDLYNEEMEHGRLMLHCYYTVELSPSISFIPGISDPKIKNTLHDLKALEKRVFTLPLDKALEMTNELERGEVNIIFGQLLTQVNQEQSQLFIEQFKKAEGHSESVPRRIRELKRCMAEMQ